MTGIVEDNSGAENKGKWDVAAVPGGAGNWGGSWLGVPTQSKYPKEAAKLADVPDQREEPGRGVQVKGPLPTNLTALQEPGLHRLHERRTSTARRPARSSVSSVANIKPLAPRPEARAVKENAFEPALQSYETGKSSKRQAPGISSSRTHQTQGAY